MADRPLPADPQAEIDLIGSVLLDTGRLADCRQVVAPRDFFDDLNRAIFSTMVELADADQAVDPHLVEQRLKANGETENVIVRLVEAAEAVPTAANALDYARTVARKAEQRRRYLAACETARVALDDRLAVRDPDAWRAACDAAWAAASTIPAAAAPWPAVVPFDVRDLPVFPTGALPDVLRRWVEAESLATQTPVDLAGLLALAVCGASVAGRVEVEPRPGWREPVNFFAAVLLEPGNRKSAVFGDATGPLRELEAELVDRARPDVARAQSQRRQDEARLKKLEAKAADKGDATARHEARELAAALAEEPVPVLPRLIVDDCTVEKLAMMLADQGGRLASFSSEGNVFDLMAGQYTSKCNGPSFDVYLKGHAGDPLNGDRVGRDSVRVERPALTCGYTIQPAVIQGLAKQPAFRGRGLLARFLFAAPRSWIGQRAIGSPPVPAAVREGYRNAVRNLAESLANSGSASGPLMLRLDAQAADVLTAWEGEIEQSLGDGGPLELLRDWGAKLAGATLRLAGILHCVERGRSERISRPTLESAVAIARYLIPHADAVLGMMAARVDPAEDDARYLLRWIERHGRREFTKSEAQHHGKRRFPRAEDIDPALGELTRRGFIRPKPTQATGPGRPPSPAYETNPACCAAPAEERSHYSRNSAGGPEATHSGNIGSAFRQVENADRVRVVL